MYMQKHGDNRVNWRIMKKCTYQKPQWLQTSVLKCIFPISYWIQLHPPPQPDLYIQQSTYPVGYPSCSRYWCNWYWPPPLNLPSTLQCIFRHLKSYTGPLVPFDQSTNRLQRSHYRSLYFYQAKDTVPKQVFQMQGFLHEKK